MRLRNNKWTAFSIQKKDLEKLKLNKASYELKHGKTFKSINAYLIEISEYAK